MKTAHLLHAGLENCEFRVCRLTENYNVPRKDFRKTSASNLSLVDVWSRTWGIQLAVAGDSLNQGVGSRVFTLHA